MIHGVAMSSRVALVCMFALAMLGAGCGEKPAAAPEIRPVEVVRVTIGSSENAFAYSGEVRPRYETNLGFRIPGKIIARNVEVGGLVRKGEVLARLDPEDQQQSARSAQSQLAATKSEYEQSKAELEPYADLYKKDFISKLEYDRRKSATAVALARLEQAQAQLAVTANQAAYATLTADHAGVVTAIPVEVGQVVAAGQTVMKLARTEEPEVAINVPENRLSELTTPRDIAISLWTDPAKTYKGKVREISPSADPVTRTYAARISVQDAGAAMKLGMTANVWLRNSRREDTITLPAAALFQDNGRPAVWVVDSTTSQVRLVPVGVGQYVEDSVVVVSGLKQGDVVVRAGVHKLFAGEKVRLRGEPAVKAGQ